MACGHVWGEGAGVVSLQERVDAYLVRNGLPVPGSKGGSNSVKLQDVVA